VGSMAVYPLYDRHGAWGRGHDGGECPSASAGTSGTAEAEVISHFSISVKCAPALAHLQLYI
jgi:hypothetical protein